VRAYSLDLRPRVTADCDRGLSTRALGTALLVYLGGHCTFGGGAVGQAALATAEAKVGLGFGQAVALGVLCNGLVCLAVWLTYSGRTTADKVVVLVPPVAAFVAAGFEHSVANMYFIPAGLFIKDGAADSFWAGIAQAPAQYAGLTWERFLFNNLLPVTAGNILGGAVLVGLVYWFVYLRDPPVPTKPTPEGGLSSADAAPVRVGAATVGEEPVAGRVRRG
jgi:formate transporter